MRDLLISASVIALLIPSAANATETVTYSYDAQGRLVQSVISGTVNNGQANNTTFDAAGNRTSYSVSLNGTVPPPSNQPPVSVADATLSVVCNTSGVRNVLGNDTDPDGDLPLSMTLTGGSGISYVQQEGPQSIRFNAPLTRFATYSVNYVITDARGATATATLALAVTGTYIQCGGSIQRPDIISEEKPGASGGG